ncbi:MULTISPECIES: response regulator transcription factor [unclassified Ectothiorhodospira]|uniref:response regulator transcription factor n=1 Tax=unclassified Ectothiorhodospira TaxID=2684909 RepID=UPI001EE8F75E|nr:MULTISPECIES: response regulator transcription factor [unclassified Ectothiorhodospira]MCG5516891.1 response regulator transcription factor [Ectothiorhodospira sp. 9100]MCG5519853.1 response regulator transcription factor [Ectothiorhodospira sp. 9905]
MRVLIVEDDAELGTRLQRRLHGEGLAVDLALNGVDGRHLGETEPYDLIVLDLGLPDLPGLEVLAAWRDRGITIPVLILTARNSWRERVEGLQQGADDYLGKPFHVEELLARILALLRRSAPVRDTTLRVGPWHLDEQRQMLVDGPTELSLTATEFKLLRYFLRHPGQVLSKTRLAEHLYEYESERDSNVLEVYISRLRDKLGADVIQTRRGQGYLLALEPGR